VFIANAAFTAGMVVFEIPTGVFEHFNIYR
jgi:hypothetical protein